MGVTEKYKTDVRLLRLRAGLTLQDVSKVIGISIPSISDWEGGMLDLKFRVEQTKKLLEIYNVSFDELALAWEATERQPSRREVKENAKLKEAIETH
jgi:transcriptional regulator with XRE-family HTH domain